MVGNLQVVIDHPLVRPGQIVERDDLLAIAGFPDGDVFRVHRPDERLGIKSQFFRFEAAVLE